MSRSVFVRLSFFGDLPTSPVCAWARTQGEPCFWLFSINRNPGHLVRIDWKTSNRAKLPPPPRGCIFLNTTSTPLPKFKQNQQRTTRFSPVYVSIMRRYFFSSSLPFFPPPESLPYIIILSYHQVEKSNDVSALRDEGRHRSRVSWEAVPFFIGRINDCHVGGTMDDKKAGGGNGLRVVAVRWVGGWVSGGLAGGWLGQGEGSAKTCQQSFIHPSNRLQQALYLR